MEGVFGKYMGSSLDSHVGPTQLQGALRLQGAGCTSLDPGSLPPAAVDDGKMPLNRGFLPLTVTVSFTARAAYTPASPMAAPVRALPLPSPVAPRMTLRDRSSCSRCRAPGVRAAAAAAAAGASRATEPVEVVGVGSRKDAVIDFCLGSRTLSSTPIRFWYGTETELLTSTLHCLVLFR